MDFLSVIYLGYMFLSMYFLALFLLLWMNNKNKIFSYPKTDKEYSVSVLVPAWNEEKTIEGTIKAIFDVDYYIDELIVINDGSEDRTEEIVKRLMKKYKRLRLLSKENSGKADALNRALKMVNGDFIAVVDADSYPAKDCFKKMIGYFDDEKVGAVTCTAVPRNKKKFFEKLQEIEYGVIAFTRKLLGYVDAIYVTPGSLSIYRKSALDKIGGFDPKNMTEDIEVTWHLTKEGYRREICLSTHVTTKVPNKFKGWYRQRRRWNVGGLQCIGKYKNYFLKQGMLGCFILPFFVLQLFLGMFGLGVFVYLITTRILNNYLFARYSLSVGTALVTMNDLHITASFLNYLGVVLLIFGGVFTLLALGVLKKEGILGKQNIFNVIFYSLVYLAAYPLIMAATLVYFARGKYSWR